MTSPSISAQNWIKVRDAVAKTMQGTIPPNQAAEAAEALLLAGLIDVDQALEQLARRPLSPAPVKRDRTPGLGGAARAAADR